MKNTKLKVMTILGTRPEIIRLARVMPLLDRHVNHIIVHTGQNYDFELNQIFFDDLELRKPDYFLNIDNSSLGSAIGDIIKKSAEILIKEKPDALLVLGDTNSSLSAYMAKRMHITIFHMEAGNRCFDQNVPEEANRKIIDHIADFNLVYTEHARRNLLSEGLQHRRIYMTGSPLKEVLDYFKPKIDKSGILNNLSLIARNYFLVSIHREENVDNPGKLKRILKILNRLAKEYKLPIIVSTHPRTRKRLKDLSGYKQNNLIRFLKPFGYINYIHLQQNSKCVISDSGTISEESAILLFPAISLRQSMERPEAQDAGTIILTGFDADVILQSVNTVIREYEEGISYTIPHEYNISDTSRRVLKLILGNARLSNKWWGLEN